MMLCIFSTCVMATLILSSLLWILTVDVVVASGCMEVERNALLTFKSGLVDPQNLLSSWEGEDCCKWRGVPCSNTTGHVVKLNLRNRNSYDILVEECLCLSGEINPALLLLSKLEHLDLSMNNFSGTSIPAYLGSFENLRYLNLSYAHFSGKIPPQIGNLSKLHYLDLSFDFTFSGNTLRVDDILWLTRLSSLKYLDMSFVNMNTSTGWLHAVNMLPSLKVLRLAACSLPGISTSSSHFNLTTLKVLDLGENQIKGRLPLLMSFTRLLYLNLSSNQFEGPLPSLPHNLLNIDLSNNFFTGVLPNIVLPQMDFLFLSNNDIGGHIPSALCESIFLEILDLSNNNLSGEIPECIGKSQEYLSVIDVSTNNLVGRIPDSLCSSKYISLLKFNSNGLSGEFPSLQNCTGLVILDLGYNKFSGTIPFWIGGSLTLLMVLQLRSNMFSGGIPEKIAQLGSLQVLDLSSNNLSGPLPRSFGNFSWKALKEGRTDRINNISAYYSVSISLDIKGEELTIWKILYLFESIDLSNNNLSGEIPDEITDLQTQQYLNLSRNNLIGRIPEKIGKMQSLESLDLAMNKLSGNQLQTLDDPSIYIGNPYLCGPPSTRNCSAIEINYEDNEGPKDKFEWLWIYFGVVLGYLFGLAVFCGVLLLNNAWRKAYFSMIDIVCDKLFIVTKVTLTRSRHRHRR
ncbi:leucine-rich repeat receptor-like protein CLAVATA2 isoform X2 [Ananas comosus]|uniref:Leucine-rich repeat receptor-like protein CLAVATA2 isoform X2 n=1 Tax=Ananas comosus TaxID=4615 RepID=A0A6P5EGW4_ANACO|nr:leucine-rich repeat receptor-like protein CLAVATA2 isoform X2 [Ananas comosus]